jgi:hypothetical protein
METSAGNDSGDAKYAGEFSLSRPDRIPKIRNTTQAHMMRTNNGIV